MGNISQKLNLSQSQNLVMTPQLQQAIKLLQLSNIELSEFIEEEIENNPLLEKDEGALDLGQGENINEDIEKNETDIGFDINDQDFDSGSMAVGVGSGNDLKFEANDINFEDNISTTKSLREHLINQLNMAFSDKRDIAIGELLIGYLDESGYLRDDIQELEERLDCSKDRIEKLLLRMKQFTPTGIFARNLSECLYLQLEEKGSFDEPMKLLLDNLDMLGDYNFKGLAEKCGVNDTYLMDMIDEIKRLDPKPASQFDHLVVQTAVADVLMKKLPKNLGGGWRVEINSETLPKVLVNQEYYTKVLNNSSNEKDREYITSKLNSANWLVRAMDQRVQTILKVASEIVEQQEAFFNYGIEFLKPLTLNDIAKKIDMHESTISRVTTNKYIGTPRGIFELKFFFSSGVQAKDGTVAHSSEAIKARIKSLIDSEDPKKILSDDKIVNILKSDGIDVARRTVAKYREAMHIGSSIQRRKQKNIT